MSLILKGAIGLGTNLSHIYRKASEIFQPHERHSTMDYQLNRKSPTYVFTLDMFKDSDLVALSDIRKRINAQRKLQRQYAKNAMQYLGGTYGGTHRTVRVPRVKVYFRRPLLKNEKGHYYAWGGGVTKNQKPTMADVYIAYENIIVKGSK